MMLEKDAKQFKDVAEFINAVLLGDLCYVYTLWNTARVQIVTKNFPIVHINYKETL